jgi:alpha-tubulin suppressor-like RCC1 family protein
MSGEIFVFGDNTHGNLGLGDLEQRGSPTKIESFSEAASYGIKVQNAAVGDGHSLVLTKMEEEDNSSQIVFAWGSNHFNQLGTIDSTPEEQDLAISVPNQVLNNFQKAISSVATASNYSAVITEDGEVNSRSSSGFHLG